MRPGRAAPNLMPLIQRLESGAPRVHLDIHTDDLDAEVPGASDSAGSACRRCKPGG
jgi:hypothetical protein